MTQLETAIDGLMKTFDTYAAVEGNKDTLSKAETKTLLEKELPSLIEEAKNQGEVNRRLQSLDFNVDDEVDFHEFVVFVATLTCVAHNRTCKK
ncbi:protein S100-P [Pleuronectes platessa]|uniref:protein S100-P n=1 Tax=Pleuronectes platessa TaxID=8262 RepID=UPI00232A4127|nr:protein S100-P [Pleuronectes platessa]